LNARHARLAGLKALAAELERRPHSKTRDDLFHEVRERAVLVETGEPGRFRASPSRDDRDALARGVRR